MTRKQLADSERKEAFAVLQSMFKATEAAFWTAEEIDLAEDTIHYASLREDERHFIELVLAFFAASDGVVTENLVGSFLQEVEIPEAKRFYAMQAAIEAIHSEVYSLLIETLVRDSQRKSNLFEAINHYSTIRNKAEWCLRYMDGNRPLRERLVGFACCEGIYFCSSFAAIYWFKKRGLMPGLTFSNELIARDESAHRDFACALFHALDYDLEKYPPMDDALMRRIIYEAYTVEVEFIKECLPVQLIGMNAELMIQYVQVVTDNLLHQFGLAPEFGVTNPLEFMEMINMQGKTNFFEKRVSDYQMAGVKASSHNMRFSLSQEF